MVPCLGKSDEPDESLRLGVRGWTNKSDVVISVTVSISADLMMIVVLLTNLAQCIYLDHVTVLLFSVSCILSEYP